MLYTFDLDSTLTKKETLPFLAKALECEKEYGKICKETANLPYSDALTKRLAVFAAYPPEEIAEILGSVPIFPELQKFITENVENSFIITSNLDIYVKTLCGKFRCKFYSSTLLNGKIRIIDKEEIVSKLRQIDKVCFTGDGENDAKALKIADFSIAASYAKKANALAAEAAEFEAYSEQDAVMYLKSLPN